MKYMSGLGLLFFVLAHPGRRDAVKLSRNVQGRHRGDSCLKCRRQHNNAAPTSSRSAKGRVERPSRRMQVP
jgi:hypothetical protein